MLKSAGVTLAHSGFARRVLAFIQHFEEILSKRFATRRFYFFGQCRNITLYFPKFLVLNRRLLIRSCCILARTLEASALRKMIKRPPKYLLIHLAAGSIGAIEIWIGSVRRFKPLDESLIGQWICTFILPCQKFFNGQWCHAVFNQHFQQLPLAYFPAELHSPGGSRGPADCRWSLQRIVGGIYAFRKYHHAFVCNIAGNIVQNRPSQRIRAQVNPQCLVALHLIFPFCTCPEVIKYDIISSASYHNKAICRSRFETASRFAGSFSFL